MVKSIKSNTSKTTQKDHAHVSLLIHSEREAVLAIAMIHCTICSKWEINPEYKKVLR
jgi:hypothetical protein